MKLKHKMLIACIFIIAITSTIITFALLTFETEELHNTFTVGQVALKLDETDVDENGILIPNTNRVTGNEYKLIPGKTYTKDPTMTILAGSETSYVRILVTITKAKEIKDVFGSDFLPEKYVTGWDKTKWISTSIKENQDNSITYEFRYHQVVSGYIDSKKEDIVLLPLFTNFIVPEELTSEDLKKIEGFEIKVIGHGIQASGFKSAEEAWNAFEEQE